MVLTPSYSSLSPTEVKDRMKKALLTSEKNFYKANLHCHTNISDGSLAPQEIKAEYTSRGYSVVAYTDHDLFIPHHELTDEKFLALSGFEMEFNENNLYPGKANIKTCHICAISLDREKELQPLFGAKYAYIGNAAKHIDEIKRDKSLPDYERNYSGKDISYVMKTLRENGFFVTYNHPEWSRESYPEYMSYHGMHAFEIMNGDCLSMGYEDYNPRVYDDILSGGERIFCIGADDNHNKHRKGTRRWDSGIAFTVINAEKLEYKTVTDALVRGDFYASRAPEIHELTYEDGKIAVKTSPADRITCSFDIRKALIDFADPTPLTCAEFTVPEGAGWFRITVTDEKGRHACTRAYFLDELEK